MSWFLLSTLAAFAFATVNIADKILLLRFAKTDIAAVKILGGVSLLIFFLATLFLHHPSLSVDVLYPFLAGVFEVAYIYWYLKAIQRETLAFLIPFFSLSPIIVLVISFLFFHSVVDYAPMFGIFLAIGGIILLARAKEGKFHLTKIGPVIFMLVAAALFGVSSIFLGAGLNALSVTDNLIWSRLGVFAGALLIAGFARQFHIRDIKTETTIFAISEVLYLITMYLFIHALANGIPALVLGVVNIQYMFVFFLSLFLFGISPKILREEFYFSSRTLAIISIGIIMIGSWMMQIN